MSDTHFGFGHFSRKWDDEVVADRYEDHDEEYGEDGEGSRWDL